jgi:hypothetical protein
MLSTRLFSNKIGIFSQKCAELWELIACKPFPGKLNHGNIWKRFQILAKYSIKVKHFPQFRTNPFQAVITSVAKQSKIVAILSTN